MWNQRYATDEFVYGTEPNTFLAQEAWRMPKGGRVLSLAEGEGRNAVFLAKQGFRVTAVDASEVGLRKAAELAATHGVPLPMAVMDLADLDLGENRWDGVVSIFAHVPPEVRKPLHRRVVQALKPGGVLILEAYTPEQVGRGTGGPPHAHLMMTAQDLREELAGLDFAVLRETERPVVEGRHHTGPGAVVQVVGRKP